MKKKIYLLPAAVSLSLAFGSAPFAYGNETDAPKSFLTAEKLAYTAWVDGIAVKNPIYENNIHTHMYPVREIGELLGYTVTWDDKHRSVTVSNASVTASMTIGQDNYVVDGNKSYHLKADAELKDGIAYAPSLFFSNFFPVTITNEENSIIQIKSNTPALQNQKTVLDVLEELEDANWANLTLSQKLEDFDYLYKTLEQNYPYFHVLERTHSVNLKEEYEKSRKAIEATTTDTQFFVAVERFIRKAQMVGHLSQITPIDYPWFVSAYEDISHVAEEDKERMEKLKANFQNEKSAETYEKLGEIFWPVLYELNAISNAATEKDDENGGSEETAYSNVKTKIIEQDKIAYIAINSFDMQYYAEDEKKLLDFYEQVKDYDHIIFDISQNGGGGMSYFNNLIVAPNIDKPLTADVYSLAKDGEYNRKFMDFTYWEPISKLPQMPRMNAEDKKDLDLMLRTAYQVKPAKEEKILKGRLWLLVSERVFSSSEYAAMFTKSTGFATLVGTQTGGDGIGVDPLPIVLPNSGLMVRYSPVYGITSDGASSQECGTMPDIISPEGELPLDTCLKEIEKISN